MIHAVFGIGSELSINLVEVPHKTLQSVNMSLLQLFANHIDPLLQVLRVKHNHLDDFTEARPLLGDLIIQDVTRLKHLFNCLLQRKRNILPCLRLLFFDVFKETSVPICFLVFAHVTDGEALDRGDGDSHVVCFERLLRAQGFLNSFEDFSGFYHH